MPSKLTEILNIEYPILLAPMFLITDKTMVKIALDNGITAAIPAFNFRTLKDLESTILEIKEHTDKSFGINLIVNKSNPNYKSQLEILLNTNIDYIITSLGNPSEVIQKAKSKNIKVFCDVVDLKYAKKVEKLGADGIIAVNNIAGGHSGIYPTEQLLKDLKRECSIPIIIAGGISTPQKFKSIINAGADGVSIGTVFIASEESPASRDYKNALINYGANDIVLTTKLSGSPTTVINTDYVQKIGTKQNFLEKMIHSNNHIKKFAKAILFKQGMDKLRKSAFSTTYKTVWCAGKSIEDIKEIRPLKDIIKDFTKEYQK